MHAFFKFSFVLFAFFSLTSCFEILDKVSLNADGSGEYSIILNASKSKTRLASIAKMETINGKKVPKKSEIESKLQQAATIFKSVPGITNVNTSADYTNYIIKLSCSFKKIENINDGIEKLKAKKVIGTLFPSQLYSNNVAAKTFTKNKISSYKDHYDKLSKADKEIFSQFCERTRFGANFCRACRLQKTALSLQWFENPQNQGDRPNCGFNQRTGETGCRVV